MAFILSTFLLVLQITFYYTEAMPTDAGHSVIIKMPDVCQNKTYCTSDIDYPQTEVDNVLKDMNLMSFAGWSSDSDESPTKVISRVGEGRPIDEIDEIHPCEVIQEEGELRYITDEQQNVRVVVQAKDRFMQFVPIVSCKSSKPVNDYNIMMVDLVDKYDNIQCVDDKLNFKFVVLSPDLKSLELARVSGGGVPVGCQCRYVK